MITFFRYFQILVRATDGSPMPCNSESNATVTVNVRRNEKAPVFEKEGQYEVTIREDLRENNRVTSIRASDGDSQVTVRVMIFTFVTTKSYFECP